MWLGNAIYEGSAELTLSEVLLHYRSGRATTTEWQEKMQKEKSNFRKYNEIKPKCLLSLSNLKTFIKITYVRVWFWGKKCLWTTWGCFLKTKTTAWENFWPFAWSEHKQVAVLTAVTSCSLFWLSSFAILHTRLWELSLHGPKPLRRARLGVTSATSVLGGSPWKQLLSYSSSLCQSCKEISALLFAPRKHQATHQFVFPLSLLS